MYFIMIYHDELMPIIPVFIMGLVSDLLISDILGGRATAMMLLCYAMRMEFCLCNKVSSWIVVGRNESGVYCSN